MKIPPATYFSDCGLHSVLLCSHMSPPEYKAERKKRGTQVAVGKLLDVHWVTMARRESGKMKISKEMELAIKSLEVKK